MTATATEPWTTARHPLARFLRTVASGHPPIADQEWTRVSPWSPTVQGMVRLTGHTIVAVSYDVVDAQLLDLGVNAVGGAFSARVISTLAGPTGWIDAPRVLLSALGTGAGQHASLTFRSDLTRHPFVEAAQRTRQDTQVLGSVDPAAAEIVVLGRGVAGVREISVYVPPAGRGRGRGTALAREALNTVPENEIILAAATIGDAAGLRGLLRAGYAVIGGVHLFSNRPESTR